MTEERATNCPSGIKQNFLYCSKTQRPSKGNGFDEKYKVCRLESLTIYIFVVRSELVEFEILTARLNILGHFMIFDLKIRKIKFSEEYLSNVFIGKSVILRTFCSRNVLVK